MPLMIMNNRLGLWAITWPGLNGLNLIDYVTEMWEPDDGYREPRLPASPGSTFWLGSRTHAHSRFD